MIGSKSTSHDFFLSHIRWNKGQLQLYVFSSCEILDEVSHTFQIHISKKSKS